MTPFRQTLSEGGLLLRPEPGDAMQRAHLGAGGRYTVTASYHPWLRSLFVTPSRATRSSRRWRKVELCPPVITLALTLTLTLALAPKF